MSGEGGKDTSKWRIEVEEKAFAVNLWFVA